MLNFDPTCAHARALSLAGFGRFEHHFLIDDAGRHYNLTVSFHPLCSHAPALAAAQGSAAAFERMTNDDAAGYWLDMQPVLMLWLALSAMCLLLFLFMVGKVPYGRVDGWVGGCTGKGGLLRVWLCKKQQWREAALKGACACHLVMSKSPQCSRHLPPALSEEGGWET